MNRLLNQFRYSFERDVVEYFAKVTIGATGAPTLSRGKGIASIVRNSAGLYTITLQDKSARLLEMSHDMLSGSSALAAPFMNIVSETVASTKLIVLQFRALDNSTATDPANGEILYLRIAVCNN